MKGTFIALILVTCMLEGAAATVHNVTVETNRMSENSLKQLFRLQPGDLFTEQSYEKAKRELLQEPMFRKLDFFYDIHEDGVDIHIRADDHTYVLPLFFGLHGNKHAVGGSVLVENLFKRGEKASLSLGGGRDGFDVRSGLKWGKHTFSTGYTHINFEQRFYKGGWVSTKDIFSSADDKGKYKKDLRGRTHGKQDDLFISYKYRFSKVWSVFVTPQYEYYRYKNNALDTGNHSHISFGLEYSDNLRADMNMEHLSAFEHLSKRDMLRDLPHLQTGKLAEITYTTGGNWTGSDYRIDKIGLGGTYFWEFKEHQTIALFAKAQRVFTAPFSNQIESSDLLFGMGIYDREQRGKGGISAGISFTWFILRNERELLGLTPFYEQAYISSGGGCYVPHSGVGAELEYRFWHIPLPIRVSFTHNLNDGSHHVGFKVGGHL